jgi:hypothetical protein
VEYNRRGKNDEELSQSSDVGEEIEVLIAEIPKIFEPKEKSANLTPSKKIFCSAADEYFTLV